MGWRNPCTAAGSRISYNIRYVGTMPAFGYANAAVRAFGNCGAVIVQRALNKTSARPFPNVSCEIENSATVGTKGAEIKSLGAEGVESRHW